MALTTRFLAVTCLLIAACPTSTKGRGTTRARSCASKLAMLSPSLDMRDLEPPLAGLSLLIG